MNFRVQYSEALTQMHVEGSELRLNVCLPHLGGTSYELWPLAVPHSVGAVSAGAVGSGAGNAGAVSTGAVSVAVAGNGGEAVAAESAGWQREGSWLVGCCGDTLWACATANANDTLLETTSRELYLDLLRLASGYRLQRVWHYLPRINQPDHRGLERYRAFCRGRSVAFESVFADDFFTRLPAASAVGCEGDQLVIYVCAVREGSASVRYLENPLQVPAYRYPETYGPRAPGFSRASLTVYGGGSVYSEGPVPDGDSSASPAAGLGAATGAPAVGSEALSDPSAGDSAAISGSSATGFTAISGTSAGDSTAMPDPSATGFTAVSGLSDSGSTASEGVQNADAFARDAARAGHLKQHPRILFISGTASIRRARSCVDGGLEGQLRTTIENLSCIAGQAGIPHLLGGEGSVAALRKTHGEAAKAYADPGRHEYRRFKIYLRHAGDYAYIAEHFGGLLRADDEVVYVRSDICRAELDLEIEASVHYAAVE